MKEALTSTFLDANGKPFVVKLSVSFDEHGDIWIDRTVDDGSHQWLQIPKNMGLWLKLAIGEAIETVVINGT